jgi:predicted ATP-grasp superfamily ATP-dependent carboligase
VVSGSEPLFELAERPDLGAPVLVVCLEGWIDAGAKAASAKSITHGRGTPSPFDTEQLLDPALGGPPAPRRRRQRRTHLAQIELSRRTTTRHAALVLTGPEPDHNWRRFVQAVIDLAVEFDTRLVVSLGAYPAATPHTRPPHLSATATSRELAEQVGFVNATLDIPAGVQAAIEHACSHVDLPAIGVWAQVPHYAAGMSYPAASAALLDGIRIVSGLEFDKVPLRDEAREVRARLDDLVERNEEHATHVRRLEEQDDAVRRAVEADLPSGDELAAEV